MNTNALDWLSMVLVIAGAINWGLLGLFEFNLVAWFWGLLFDAELAGTLEAITYILVGLAGLYLIYTAYKMAQDRRMATEETTTI